MAGVNVVEEILPLVVLEGVLMTGVVAIAPLGVAAITGRSREDLGRLAEAIGEHGLA